MSATKDAELVKAVTLFREKFGCDPTVAAFAPGRVNLIGEHVDYNGGFVLPFALPYRTIIVGALAPATAKFSTVVSGGSDLPPASFEINSSMGKGEPEWANYIKGSIFQYLAELPSDLKLNAVVVSDVPMGAGLSSSAALE
jgi:galactokinase